ncbi:PREDICTED: uncharacterized protein LOC109475144 [Branchiostoma belcheri]|uniref:Uncharacterized protein LOC109475144 n=1 Tax=Branchiostoma belcheri TaxID=7741 RepID=A0A6P4ZBH6_BRABE|nr:PREDICTED: uncharacterized protein LOC109475144 [Branchiostoma belcheri]
MSHILSSNTIIPGTCGRKDNSLSKTSIQPPVVVIAADVSPVHRQEGQDMVEQCRQVWEHDKGVTVAMGDNSIIQLVSTSTGNTTATSVAMALGHKHSTQTNSTHDNTKNISCILFKNGNYTELFFTTPRVETKPQMPVTSYKIGTDQADDLTSQPYTTDKSSGPSNTSPVPPGLDHILVSVSVVVPTVSVLVLSILVSVALKLKVFKVQNNIDTSTAAAFPALRRSASLPVRRCRNREVQEDSASCKSLPAVLVSTEPIYSVIPDNVAAAQRPLPAFPPTCSDIPEAVAADQSAIPHTYCDIPDHDHDGMGPNLFYAATTDQSLCTGCTPYGDGIRINQADVVSALQSHHSVAGRESAMYRADIGARGHHISVYGTAPNATSQQRQAQGLGRRVSLPLTILPNN